jgi:hypothetical protein
VDRSRGHENKSAKGLTQTPETNDLLESKDGGELLPRFFGVGRKGVSSGLSNVANQSLHGGCHCHLVQIDMYDWIGPLSSSLNIFPITPAH